MAAFQACRGRVCEDWLALADVDNVTQADTVAAFARMPLWKVMPDITRQLIAFVANPDGLDAQTWVAINTEFKEVDESGKKFYHTGRPEKLNQLSAKFKAETDKNKKLDIVLEMERCRRLMAQRICG